MTAAAYYAKMKTIRDELVATGKGPDNEEFISFVLNGLNLDYNSLVSSVLGRIDTITISDFYAELLSFEMRLQMLKETPDGEGQFQSLVNAASRMWRWLSRKSWTGRPHWWWQEQGTMPDLRQRRTCSASLLVQMG